MVTPLIQKLKNQSGTFYAFPSAISQQDKCSNDDDFKFVFSKFVCLKIPSIKTPTNKQNNIQFLTIDGQIYNGLSAYNTVNLAQSFQNYCLNLESLILNSTNYDNSTLKTISERVFFKWLKELGAIRFRDSQISESGFTRYVEENDKTSGDTHYEKVVKYIGDIDIVNNVQYSGQNYTEVYINIPSNVGFTPTVLFNAVEDNNYKPDLILKGNDEYLLGRDSATIHPESLSLFAFYDYDTSTDYINSINANWYNQSVLNGSTNSYFTELNTFTDSSNIEITKSNLDYSGVDPFTTINYLRSKLDGISLDFNPLSYTYIVDEPLINTIQEYNSSTKSGHFEFNAILVYYDIYNEKTNDIKETNLYGILFLDNLVETVDESYIPVFKKYKHNNITNQNGNSYGLKLNLRSSQSILNSGVETIINDYNTFSMSLFSDTMVQLQNSVINFQEQNRQIIDISNRLSYIENLIYNIGDIVVVKEQISELRNIVNNANIAFSNSNVLLDMISNLNKRVNDIMSNKTSIDVSYNTDVLQFGTGINIDKSVKNKVIIENKAQQYNICLVKNSNNVIIDKNNLYDYEIEEPKLYVVLKDFTNYIKIYTIINGNLDENFNIYIIDRLSTFKTGQVLRIVFANYINFNSYNLKIYTDYNNKFGFGQLKKVIATIGYSELSTTPIIDLICIDKDTYTFDYDIIK